MSCGCRSTNDPDITGGECSGGCGSREGIPCSSDSDCQSGGGSGGFCFVKETKITMSDNTLKNIEDVEIGDEVISWNEETKKLSTAKVIKLKRPIHKNMVTIEWEHGVTTNTFDHPFYSVTKNEWISYKPELTLDRYDFDDVQQLEVGNPINPIGDIGLSLDKNNKLVESKILSIKENIEEIQTYIFELDKDNTFFANGILTHNKGAGGGGGGSASPPSAAPKNPFSSGPPSGGCQRGYYMSNSGVCKEGSGNFGGVRRRVVPRRRKINSSRVNKNFVGSGGNSVNPRTPLECCYDLNARYECRFGCIPCSYWNGFQWITVPGTDCFQITSVTSECPSGANPQMTAEACLNYLEATTYTEGSCTDQLQGSSGFGTVSGPCGCEPHYNYECPNQNPVDCDEFGNCGPPKLSF